MHIAFKFQYIHDNGLFIRLLNRIAELSVLPLSLHHEGSHYRIEVSGEQEELEAFAEQISLLVPKSLFLEMYSIEEIPLEEQRDDPAAYLQEYDTNYKVPYCPECQNRVIETLNPFIPCKVCGFSDTSISQENFSEFTGVNIGIEEGLFLALAEMLITHKELTLATFNGVRHFSLLDSHGDSNQGILLCNPEDISDKFLITQGELDTLMLIEKPTVRLKPKLMFRVEHALNEPFYPLFFADDKITLAFTTALKSKGIDAIFCDHVPSLRVATALKEEVIITSGRDMLPWKYDLPLQNAAFCRYAGVEAYGDQTGLLLNKKIELRGDSLIRYASNQSRSATDNTIYFEPAHAALRSVVLENALEKKALCGVYLSHENPCQIFSFSTKIGYSAIVEFSDEMPHQPKEMMQAIAKMDEGGMRLVENFKKTFPQLYEKIIQVEFTQHMNLSTLSKLWAFAAVSIGLYEGDDMRKACEVLESTAIEFSGKSGPRIDYKVLSTNEGYQLDPRLAIRSAMSFKLAGLDDYLLSFGFIDSLADFIAAEAEDADANIGIEGVALCGSLFENRQLLMRTYNALSVNYPIYRNRRLSADGANIALGAITLGNE